MAVAASERSRKLGPRALTLMLGALIAIAPLAMDIYLASMPSMTRALAATPEQVQLTLSVYMYAWGAAQLFSGPLSDRFGRRPLLIGGLIAFVAASMACALSKTVGVLIAARALQAVAMATVAVVPRAVVRDLYAGDRAAYVLSLMGIVLGVAPVVAPIIGSHLHVWFGWQANFVFVAVYAALLLAWVARALPETLAQAIPNAMNPAAMTRSFTRLSRSRRFAGYLLVASFTMAGLFAFLAGSAFVFVDVMGQGERGFGFLFGAVMLGNITGAMIGSRLVTRWGIDRLLARATWLVLVAGLSLLVVAWAGVRHPLAVVVPMFVYMIGLMTTMPQATAGALTPFPEIAGSASSLLSFAQFVVASSAALAVGLTFDGTPRAMATVIAIAAIGAFVAFRSLIGRHAAAGSAIR
jgi:MFS transporter, DHA1 family, multidrug resistance protein